MAHFQIWSIVAENMEKRLSECGVSSVVGISLELQMRHSKWTLMLMGSAQQTMVQLTSETKNSPPPDISEQEIRAYGRYCTQPTPTYHYTTHESSYKTEGSIFTYITVCRRNFIYCSIYCSTSWRNGKSKR